MARGTVAGGFVVRTMSSSSRTVSRCRRLPLPARDAHDGSPRPQDRNSAMGNIERPKVIPPPQEPQRPVLPAQPTAPLAPTPQALSPAFPVSRKFDPPKPEPRGMRPNPTGLYEQISCQRIPCTVQISCVGNAIVGWFALPPGKTSQWGGFDASWPALDRDFTSPRSGAFIVDTRRPHQDGGFDMQWWVSSDTPDKPNRADPTQYNSENFEPHDGVRRGLFRPPRAVGPPTVIGLKFSKFADKYDEFSRYSVAARLPAEVLYLLDVERAREMAIVEQCQPMAPRWIQSIVDKFTSTEVKDAIASWFRESADNAKPARINAVARLIPYTWLEPGNMLPDLHRKVLVARLGAILKTTPLSIDKATWSMWEWFEMVAADSVRLDKSNTGGDREFRVIGLAPGGKTGSAYRVSYQNITPSAEISALLGIGGAGFLATVQKVGPIEFAMHDGVRTLDADGNPIPEPADIVDQAIAGKAGASVTVETFGRKFGSFAELKSAWRDGLSGVLKSDLLLGVFGDASAGLAFEFATSELSDPGYSGKTQKTGGSPLSSVIFYSDLPLTSAADFDGAWFHIALIKGPGAVAAGVGASAPFSACHLMWLDKGTLETIVSQGLDIKWPDNPLPKLILGGKQAFVDWVMSFLRPKITISAFEVAVGYGTIQLIRLGPPPPTQRKMVNFIRAQSAIVAAKANAVTLFNVNKADFRGRDDAFFLKDGRYMLEVFLSTIAPLFLSSGDINIVSKGYASPEDTAENNQTLSVARADMVWQGILDAFGGSLPLANYGRNVFGLGEVPALNFPGMLRPPDGPEFSSWLQRHPEQPALWPAWRKVDLELNGLVVVRGMEVLPDPQ